MNILIIGNGFDLSHYLPTKYDHFMDVMKAIEEKDLGQPIKNIFDTSVDDLTTLLIKIQQFQYAFTEKTYQMNFDELFAECRDKWFIDKTKEIYITDSIKLSFEQIIKIQHQLKKNDWYQYFDNHVREVKSWIDFEIKISEALKVIASFLIQLENKIDEFGSFSTEICFYGQKEPKQLFLTREYCNILELFKILKSGYYIDEDCQDELGRFYTQNHDVGDEETDGDFRFYIREKYIILHSGFLKIKVGQILDEIYTSLDEFIKIFNHYLEITVSKLQPKDQLRIDAKDWIYPEKIYSFNYTNTYQRFYDAIEVDYLHGSFGENQNIVLGISELEHENLIKLKAYGFTKYHQKIFKDTDYLFLNDCKDKIENHKLKIENLEKDFDSSDSLGKRFARQNLMEVESKLNITFYIWGHSLDISDKDYIIDLFSLNDDMDRNVRVTVYYFDKNAKFSLLNNLLAILGKEKVETWMKKNWLKFEKNPRIMMSDSIS
ncbi:AbiH family protein [Acinetobacter guerrae]|uniref:AbiH family protein n=1 Tax=Acinetobacter guerrae TaxID=1843371 RepID=UPI00128AF584|nr:AbiH family protein [Acinetobacter guerrae]MPW44166.1 hypothetical protein [Acinetobacter guerrae]